MWKFIKFIIIFSILLTTIISTTISICEGVINKNANFHLDVNPRYIVIGHSHPECAFNDSLITNFKNLSKSAESYFYTYFKIKKVIDQNPTIEVVFIEFTNNQITEKMNKWTWSNQYLDLNYPKYSSFMSILDKFQLASNNFKGFMNSNSLATNQNLGRIKSQNFKFGDDIGGYVYLIRNKTDSLISKLNDENYSRDVKVSETNLLYLTKIIDYLIKENKKIILIRSPQHKLYPEYSFETKYQKIRTKRFPNVEYLDFSEFPLKNSEFGDLEHLNHSGARIFSIWFSNMLKKGLLNKVDKRDFIEGEIKILKEEKNL